MHVQIFDVEHGACALVTSNNGARILIDCGYNSTTGWRPSAYLCENGINEIDLLVVTNYDEDHVNDLPNLRARVRINSLLRNTTVTADQLFRLKSENGIGVGMRELCQMIKGYTGGPYQRDWSDVERCSFHNSYLNDFEDENNLSLVVFLHDGTFGIVFGGDLEEAGWLRLLQATRLIDVLPRVGVFVASHHGREDGQCAALFGHGRCQPALVVISDKPIVYATQESVSWYGARTSGIPFNGGQIRKVLTTRNDGDISIYSSYSRWYVQTQY